MNKKQKVIAIILAFLLIIQLLFPPYFTIRTDILGEVHYNRGFQFIFATSGTVNVGMLIVQLVATSFIGAIIFFVFKDKTN